jgi:hypothetical protein
MRPESSPRGSLTFTGLFTHHTERDPAGQPKSYSRRLSALFGLKGKDEAAPPAPKPAADLYDVYQQPDPSAEIAVTGRNLSVRNMGSRPGTKNALQLILDRLVAGDPTLVEIQLSNSSLLGQKDENWSLLASALENSPHVTAINLANVNMRDEHCLLLTRAWATCRALQRLNVETNQLTGTGIEAIAYMAETHPSLRELHLANQRLAVGGDAEQALANALSQNTRITKLSFAFREKFVQTYADKYIRRNLDLVRRQRVSGRSEPLEISVEPYPYPRSGGVSIFSSRG